MDAITQIIDKIKQKKPESEIISDIIDILYVLVSNQISNENNDHIQSKIKKIGRQIKSQCPYAFPILNVLLRILTVIKTTYYSKEAIQQVQSILRKMLTTQTFEDQEKKKQENLQELVRKLKELLNAVVNCCQLASLHISKNETILIYADNKLLEEFIRNSFNEIQYTLLIVLKDEKNKPEIDKEHSNKEILFISEKSVFSIMNKVNKVFMDSHAIMHDGTVMNDQGSYNIAIVAKEFAVPLFIIAPRYKFTPLYAFAQDTFNQLEKPQCLLQESEGLQEINVLVNKYNLIPSDYITIIITEDTEYSTTYVYRVFAEFYQDTEYDYPFE